MTGSGTNLAPVDSDSRRTGLVVGEAIALLAIGADIVAIFSQALPFPRKILVGILALLIGLAISIALPAMNPRYRRTHQRWVVLATAAATLAALILVPNVEGLTAPTGLACDSSATTSTSIGLTWVKPASGKVVNYEVVGDGTTKGSPAGTFFSDTGLKPETRHEYYVRARGHDNEQERSDTISCTTQATAKGLGAPVNLVVTALTATGSSLRWEPPTTGTPTAYRVMRNGAEVFLTAGKDQLTYDDPGLEAKHAYTYVIRAVDADKLDSPDSNAVQVDTPDKDAPPSDPPLVPPTAPRSLRAPAVSQTSVTLAWDTPISSGTGGLSGYQIAFGSQTVSEPGTQRKIDGLSPNTTYTFRVTAVSAHGLKSGYTTLSLTTPPPVGPPPPSLSGPSSVPFHTSFSLHGAHFPCTAGAQINIYFKGPGTGGGEILQFGDGTTDDDGNFDVGVTVYHANDLDGQVLRFYNPPDYFTLAQGTWQVIAKQEFAGRGNPCTKNVSASFTMVVS